MDVTMGIMAHNEERNIAQLLEALLRQKTKSVRINEIIFHIADSHRVSEEFRHPSPAERVYLEFLL